MSYTFSDQQGLLSILLGDSNTGTDDAFPLAVRKKYINRGEMQFAKDTKMVHEKTSGTVASSQISLPSDFLEIYALIIDNKVLTKEREISVKDYERWYNYNGNIPLYYVSEESGTRYIKLLGSANGLSYTLYYIRKPSTELSSDSDTSILPEEFREASVYYAAHELLQQAGKNSQSDRLYAKYQKFVRDGQDYVERLYMNKDYAHPDTNMIGGFTNDIQGNGYDFA